MKSREDGKSEDGSDQERKYWRTNYILSITNMSGNNIE